MLRSKKNYLWCTIALCCSQSAYAEGSAELLNEIPTAASGTASLQLRNGATVNIDYVDYDGLAVIEGDMIIGSTLAMDDNYTGQGVGYTSVGRLWKDGVLPYRISSSLSSQSRKTFEAAVNHWTSQTGIRFVEIDSSNAMRYPDYALIEDATGCAAHVGRNGGTQKIMLSSQCTVGNAIHEIGHTLGLFHEQTRTDRDDYVQINYENIRAGYEANFKKSWYSSVGNLGGYDYDSIMHYGSSAFSSNGGSTIRALDLSKNAKMGQRNALSDGDIKSIQTMYATDLNISIYQISDQHEVATVQVTISNLDDFGANDVEITLETEAQIVSALGEGWSCSSDSGLKCNKINIPSAGQSQLTLRLISDLSSNNLTASLSAASVDLNPSDNQASTSISLTPTAGNHPPYLMYADTISISDDPYPSEVLATLVARDPEDSTTQFELIGGTASNAVSISTSTGQISVYDADAARNITNGDFIDVKLNDGLADSEIYRIFLSSASADPALPTTSASSSAIQSIVNSSSGDGSSGGGAISFFGLLIATALGVVSIRRYR